MEIHEIKYFLAVCETLNFTRASEICNVSQPSLSRAIQGLEMKLGAGPLIARERANTHLTELGRLMEPYFRRVLENLEAAQSTARIFAAADFEVLRLGLMCTIGPLRLVNLLDELMQKNPWIKLQLIDGSAVNLQEQLILGNLDAAIYCRPTMPGDDFHVLPLYEERFVIAFPPEHEWSHRPEISFRDLHQQPYINRINCEYNDHIDAIFDRLGVVPTYPYESERDDWVQAMVMAGLGCTSIPEFAISSVGMAWRPLVDPVVTRTVSLITVRGRPYRKAVGALVHSVKRQNWPTYESSAHSAVNV